MSISKISLDRLALVANQNIKERNFWLEQLSGEPVKGNFPFDYKKPDVNERRMRAITFEFPPGIFSGLIKLSRGDDYTLNVIFVAGLVILLNKYIGSSDIMIGAPIYKQDIEKELVNTTLVLRNCFDDQASFKQILLLVKQTIFEATENYCYPIELLPEKLNMPVFPGEFPLFDIVILHQGIHDKNYIQPLSPNIIFSFTRTAQQVELTVEYDSLLYAESTIERIIGHFTRLFQAALFNLDLPISRLDILSGEEKLRLLKDFNNTAAVYPGDKAIHHLFEEQAEKIPGSTAVVYEDKYFSYNQLNKSANLLVGWLKKKGVTTETIVGIMMKSSFDMAVGLLAILKAGGAYLPINPWYPGQRIRYLMEDGNVKLLLTNCKDTGKWPGEVLHLENIDIHRKGRIKNQQVGSGCPVDTLAYVIYTSGSTGNPKGVMVGHRAVVRLVKNTNYLQFRKGNRILQTGALEFDASTFEIWGALLNEMGLVLAPKDSVLEAGKLKKTIQKYEIDTIWMTAPLFNRMLDVDIEIFKGLTNLLVGGDVLSTTHINQARKRFPGLKIINGYGPTENTTFSTTFEVDKEYSHNIPIGKPIANSTVYIIDKYFNPVPIGVQGELLVGGDGVARGYLNNPGLTREKFIDFQDSTIYRTGDMARWLPDGNIEFLGRIDQQVKLRGFRIELKEIEKHLLEHPGIKDVVVVANEDKSSDKYLCAYIVLEQAEMFNRVSGLIVELKNSLSGLLPEYMIPSHFLAIEKIPLTPNGKIDRKALPTPGPGTVDGYIPPGTAVEERLTRLWSEVLGIAPDLIGIDHNFFELGGHSLKATLLLAKIQKALHVQIPLAEIFVTPTIRQLAQYIDNAVKEKYAAIEPVEKKEYYVLSSAQKRLYILWQVDLDSTAYNIPQIIPLDREPDQEKLENTSRQLIARHESLRTSFHMLNDQPVQKIHHQVDFAIEYYQSPGSPEPVAKSQIHSFIRPFDLSRAPLLRVGLLKIGDKRHLLLVDMHHIISDGISNEILAGEFIRLYKGETLPSLRIQYKDFAGWQHSEKVKESLEHQEVYWLKTFEREIPVLTLPTDEPRPPVQSFAGNSIDFDIPLEQVSRLKALALESNATLYMVWLAIYNVFLSRLSSQEDIVIGTPIAGRRHPDLQKIIGMFVNTLALRNFPGSEKTFREFLSEIKHRTLEAFENQEYPFEDLVDQVELHRDISRNPLFDVMFSLQNMTDLPDSAPPAPAHQPGKNPGRYKTAGEGEIEEPGTLKPGDNPFEYKNRTARFDLDLIVQEAGDNLYFTVIYSTRLFKPDTIRRWIAYFQELVSSITIDADIRLSALELLSAEEKTRVLYEFNDTDREYPGGQSIHKLFLDEVEKTPDRIALVGRQEKTKEAGKITAIVQLSSRELQQKAHHLSSLLKAKGVKPDTVVGLAADRTTGMIIGVLGILESKGAYLPIDPDYPADRISYMLADSGAKILVISPDSPGKFEKLLLANCQLLMINEIPPNRRRLDDPPGQTLPRPHPQPAPGTCLAYIIYTSGTTGKPKGVMINHANVINLVWGLREKIYHDYNQPLHVCVLAPYVFDASVKQVFAALLLGYTLHVVPGEDRIDGARLLQYYRKHNVDISDGTPAHISLLLESLRLKPGDLAVKHFIIGGEALSASAVLQFFNHFKQKGKPNPRITNVYGPAECCVDSTYYEVTPFNLDRFEDIPIGTPMPNYRIYIVDRWNHLQPIGLVGELCVGGAGVGRGY